MDFKTSKSGVVYHCYSFAENDLEMISIVENVFRDQKPHPDAIKFSPRMLGICARYGSRLGRWISKSRSVECPRVTDSLQKCVFEEF